MSHLLSVLAAAALCVALLLLSGCGETSEAEQKNAVIDATQSYMTALFSGDAEGACAQLTEDAQSDAVDRIEASFGSLYEVPSDCVGAVGELQEIMEVAGAELPSETEINTAVKESTVVIDGDSAEITYTQFGTEGTDKQVTLERSGDQWLLTDSQVTE